MKKLLFIGILLCLVAGCQKNKESIPAVYDVYPSAEIIVMNDDSATLNGNKINESDYSWHIDLESVHEDIKNCPAEYYTGTKSEQDIYIDHDLVYYPLLDSSGFKLIDYDGEQEWAYYYQDGENNEYIFGTLPSSNRQLPVSMMYSEEEALTNKVLHINKEGVYILEGRWKGQISVDVAEEKVTLIFNNVEVECTVAPAFVVYSAYQAELSYTDISENNDLINEESGVNIILYEGTENSFTGKNIYRMLKTQYKNESTGVQKKAHKIDSPFYSFVTMCIQGEGKLTINSSFEGLGTEMHLAVYGGDIVINSQDDGINVNEDNTSVAAFYDGNIVINAAQGSEGDGIDSNGYIIVDGAKITVNNVRVPDNALDSEDGILYKSGKIVVGDSEVNVIARTYHSIDGANSFGPDSGRNNHPWNNEGLNNQNRPDFNEQRSPDEPGFKQNDFFKTMENEFDLDEFKRQVNELDDNASLMDVLELLGIQEHLNPEVN